MTVAIAPEGTVNSYYDPSTDQFLSTDPLINVTGQPYVFTNDNPLNATDPLGLYDCTGKNASHIAARYRRGDQAINLVCGYRNSPGQTGYGVNHIQGDNKHFGGDLSKLALAEIAVTIRRGTPTDRRGPTVAYVEKFQVNSNSPNLPYPMNFTVRVVVDDQTGRVTTAYIQESIVDHNKFDDCHFAGLYLC